MATLVLSAAGGALGGALGGPLGAAIGQSVGALIGSAVDSSVLAALSPDEYIKNEGQKLKQSQVTFASEGIVVTRHWGRNRLGGNIIWATRFKETKNSTTQDNGGKGTSNRVTTENVNYTYSVSFAVAFCEGNTRVQLGRVWADGKLVDLSKYTYRFYAGTETQTADTFIETIEGTGMAPAYRGIAYLVFEEMELEAFGNRVPQITAEIIKGPKTLAADDLESLLSGVALIPGAGEFVYGTRQYVSTDAQGNSTSQNAHNGKGVANLVASLDNLEASVASVSTVNLVVSWFGDDLRCATCDIQPRVEYTGTKTVSPAEWSAGGLVRSTANSVSLDSDNNPYYGGTPADITVREAIIELKARGMRVVFYPFILMDVPPGNTLPDPYSDNAATVGQPDFPWRGRITVSPAAGYVGSVDKTATAGTQIATFTGTAAAADFGAWNGSTIPYSGPVEWSYRRMVLHYAKLVSDLFTAGDIFIIGSEMVGLTQARESATAYPLVADLVTLASDVSGVLGAGRLVSYAADWSEYHSHRPSDGTGDVFFNLDPLWSSADIDFVGIDNYLPMSDWRDGSTHLDYVAGNTSIYSGAYLQSNIEGGEYFDWYYANTAARTAQTRTTITDGTYSKPWVFRQKDIRNWWLNSHIDRPAGVESGATSWVAQGKPIYFTEFGCPSVDKGTNQPNVFVDAKSSESAYPYFSSQLPDELIQRRYLEEMLKYWRDNAPTSSVYADKMVKPANMLAWTWDARPFPEFPYRSDIWSDAANYVLGHWLNGRLPMITLPSLVTEIAEFVDLTGTKIDVDDLFGAQAIVRGFTIDNLASPREMVELLMGAHHFDAFTSEGVVKFTLRAYPTTLTVAVDDFVISSDNPGGYSLTRAQETELPALAKVSYIDETNDYQIASVDAVKQTGQSKNTISASYPLVIPEAQARAIPQVQIMQAWTARERGQIGLAPSKLAIDPGDVLSVTVKGRTMSLRVDGLSVGEFREASVFGFDVENYTALEFQTRQSTSSIVEFYGPSIVEFAQLPMLDSAQVRPWAPRVLGYQSPWPGAIAVYQDDDAGGWNLNTSINGRAVIGELAFDFYSGAPDVWDNGNDLYVDIYSSDQVLGSTDLAVLNGANLVAVENSSGGWEVLQFVNAALQSTKRYKLSRLLRGQGGTEGEMRDPVSAGARVIMLSMSDIFALDVSQSTIFQDIIFRYGPNIAGVADFRFQQKTVSIDAVGLRPFAPVHLTAALSGNDWTLGWTRRTRFDGDSWVPASVPLNEDAEEYEIEIMNGAVVVRTVVGLGAPAWVYTSADQVTDFGSNQSSLKYQLYQISASYGRGAMAVYP